MPAGSRRRDFARKALKRIAFLRHFLHATAKGLKDTGFIKSVLESKRPPAKGELAKGGTIDNNLYRLWMEKNEPTREELERQKIIKLENSPKISVIVPIHDAPEKSLLDTINSVLGQSYPNWELCMADSDGGYSKTKETIDLIAGKDERIKVKRLETGEGTAENANEALSMAAGEFIALLDHGDSLAPFALFEVIKAINENPGADFIYSDEDKISHDTGRRFGPHFKPGWSPDTLRSYNYICHLFVFKKELLDKIGFFREGFEGSEEYDLILRASEKAERIVHIPKVLYHHRSSSSTGACNQLLETNELKSAKLALEEHIARIGLKGKVENGIFPGSFRINYLTEKKPKVSIIIPNKDHVPDLRRCINSILDKSTYSHYEIIILENNSTKKRTFNYYDKILKLKNVNIITWNHPFNYYSANNFAAKHASGEILLFLNNDTEVINPDWMERLLEHAVREEIGAVGAKLLYPNDTVQHGGVILKIGGIAAHAHRQFPKDSPGYMGRLMVVQNLSAVTAACLMTRKKVFEEVGGFDEGYRLAYGDVDLCLKIREKGYLVVWTPFAELYHYESKTRGYEDTPEKQRRFAEEIELFKQRWGKVLEEGDPYYNPNLTLEKEDFSLSV